ncbi:hypothetical protein A2960_01840 [Candidatus Gottesmanbacteria bacterium RIFCSPLOWO2_01_FULL_39_12b]|uniref:2,3-bisphosphoglycerate-dependent phosphoglycerate mutase n=1 Tax=Candidatus Gottesmanbacteria bacterium RIFCSPLOWO2_01_FULL_39_12b TaxID=1798388 RepID=A0A1F6AQA6_9BACT|nr:MAG: hypothetical protein A2960_01840 [Candidatus Gottesmanbacteria bacterium RIFCSPLOWO2_01_FULL_39_12b]
MGKLVLIRHGESVWNKKGWWTGWHDVPLSEKGKTEAKTAAATLKGMVFHHTFTSDLVRAWETLEIIKRELKITDLPTVRHPALKERNYGHYAGKSKWQIQKKLGEKEFNRIRRGWNTPIKNGETLMNVFERVKPYFDENIYPHLRLGKNVLLVAHGNSIRALIKHLEGVSDRDIEEVEIKTGEVLLYDLDQWGRVISSEKRFTNQKAGKQ